MQVMDFLEENVGATPEALGDLHKETPEERAERHERVVASSLAAMRNLLDVLLPTQASGPRGVPLRDQSFLRRHKLIGVDIQLPVGATCSFSGRPSMQTCLTGK